MKSLADLLFLIILFLMARGLKMLAAPLTLVPWVLMFLYLFLHLQAHLQVPNEPGLAQP